MANGLEWRRDPEGLASVLLIPGPGQNADDIGIGTARAGANSYAKPLLAPHDPIDPEATYWQPNLGRCSGGRFVKRGEEGLQTLSALGIDCDYRDGREPGALVAEVARRLLAMNAPSVSWWLASGRGVWAFWLLRHPDHADLPLSLMPRDDPARTAAFNDYRAIVKKAGASLDQAGLPFDSSCSNPCRLSRIPGTLHPTGREVRWAPVDLATRYSLDELGTALMGLDWRAVSNPVPETPPGGSVSGTKLDSASRLRKQGETRMRVLLELQRRYPHRPTIGDRHAGIIALAAFASRAGYSVEQAKRIVIRFAEGCGPPEQRREAERQTEDIYSNRERTMGLVPVSNATMGAWFGVDAETVQAIAHELGRGGESIAAARWRQTRQRAIRRGEPRTLWRRVTPRQEVVRLLNTHPGLAALSCRELSDRARNYGISAGHSTCNEAKRAFLTNRGSPGCHATPGGPAQPEADTG